MPMLKMKLISIFALCLCAVLPWNATAVSQDSAASRFLAQKLSANTIERLLTKTLLEIKLGELAQALATIDDLIKTTPNFKLAYLIRGDLLSSKARTLTSFGDVYHGQDDVGDVRQIEDLRDEAQVRLENYLKQNKEDLQPNLLIQLDPTQQYVMVVDTAKSRLFVYAKTADQQLKYLADYYVTIGKNGFDKKVQGDKRTPLGVYFAASKLNQPLPDMYGDGAYPLNYPNEVDRHEKRNGYGIWLHGTPTDTYSRPPRASDGCVVLANPDIKALHPILNKGNTPVIISSNLQWVKAGAQPAISEQVATLNQSIEQWRLDWVSQDSNQYLSHYSSRFFYSDGDYEKWANYKRTVQAVRQAVQIELRNISVFEYPNAASPMVVVNFEQVFKSPSLNNTMKKRQYWINENNQWKIIYEGAA